ncbi:hypothetical protein PMIN04_002997 [Paraphaeosphaeria minitans]|uniref:Uncharacterized protein n=1 Tax=Paraphaeosphaeria minitans TaxID=565426 RepID=A0A9P6KSD1_9PLEO|nr:hypothetical protein PMIN01_05487 [Paraphaeosphaeria minitans]
MAACGGIRLRDFEGLNHQVTCSERVSPIVSTCLSPSLQSQGYRNVGALPHSSGTIRFRTEKLSGYDNLGINRRHLDFEKFNTDDEAANSAQIPDVHAQANNASSSSALQQLNTFKYQGCDMPKDTVPKKTITLPLPPASEGSLHMSAESLVDRLSFDINTEDNDFGKSCVEDCDCEKNLEYEYGLMPGLVCDNGPVPVHLHPVPGSELEPDFELYIGSDTIIPPHPDTVVSSSSKTGATTTKRTCHRRANRSDPEYSRDRRLRNVKARAQYMRDRSFRSTSMSIKAPTALRARNGPFFAPEEVRPKRKHCAFVQEQEWRCLFEDRVGTPHLSELQPGDNVNAQLNVDELIVGGEVAGLSMVDGATKGLSTFAIAGVPNKKLGLD